MSLIKPSSFNPGLIAGCKLWLKAGVGVWQDTGGTTPAVANNDPVGRWDDQSGLGNNAVQATAGFRPLINTGATLNGYKAITTDGTDDVLVAPSVNFGNQLTAFIVYNTAQVTGQRGPVGIPVGTFYLWHSSSSNFYGFFESGAHKNTTQAALSGNQIVNWEFDSSGLLGKVYRNGAQVGGDVTLTSVAVNGAISVMSSTSSFMAGSFYEMLIYSGILSTADRNNVTAYLNAKFAVY